MQRVELSAPVVEPKLPGVLKRVVLLPNGDGTGSSLG